MNTDSGALEPPLGSPAGAPQATDCHGPDPEVMGALRQACVDFDADPLERLALFAAALVASNLRREPAADDGRLGPLAQPPAWGPPAARRDPYTAATVFLRQARHLRVGPHAPRRAAGLAARVQGRPGAWRHALVRRQAKRILSGLQFPDNRLAPAVAPGTVTAQGTVVIAEA